MEDSWDIWTRRAVFFVMSIGQTNIGMTGNSGLPVSSGVGVFSPAGKSVARSGFSHAMRAGLASSHLIYSPVNSFQSSALHASSPVRGAGGAGAPPSTPGGVGGAGGGDGGDGSSNDDLRLLMEKILSVSRQYPITEETLVRVFAECRRYLSAGETRQLLLRLNEPDEWPYSNYFTVYAFEATPGLLKAGYTPEQIIRQSNDIIIYARPLQPRKIYEKIGTVVEDAVQAGLSVGHVQQVIGAILKNPIAKRRVIERFGDDDAWKQFFLNPDDEHLVFKRTLGEGDTSCSITKRVEDREKAELLLYFWRQWCYRYNSHDVIEALPELVRQLRPFGLSSDEMASTIIDVVEASGGFSHLAFESVPVALRREVPYESMIAFLELAHAVSMVAKEDMHLFWPRGIFRALPHLIEAGLEPAEIKRLCWDFYKHLDCLKTFQQMEKAFPAAVERMASVFSREKILSILGCINDQYKRLARIVYFYLAEALSEAEPGESTAVAEPFEVVSIFLDEENRATPLGKAIALAGMGWLFKNDEADYGEMMRNLRDNLARESVVQGLLDWYGGVEDAVGSQDLNWIRLFVELNLAVGSLLDLFSSRERSDEQHPNSAPLLLSDHEDGDS